ncbi:YcaO-like family protein, partial [Frankia casuarinae]|uniref:YcaO-like family protein n=3 Tax=Frankia TaxID=1854 RepID=UPI001F3A48BE
AERFALEELFERDANTIWWASGAAGWAVADAAELLDRHDIAHGEGTGRTIRLFQVPSQFPVPVLAAFLEEPGRGLIAYGTACRADPREAATKALVEAFAMLELTAELADGDSAHWRAVARGEIPPHTYLPYRADRRYADDIRPDFRDLVDLPAVAQLYLDPRMQGRPLDRLRDDTRTTRLADIPRADGDANGGTAHRRYLDMLATQGLSAVSVDVTTPDVRAAGLTVVRVIVPGLYGNPPAAFPFLGGERLYDVPAQLGLAAGKITEDALYPYPIPHV